jgi:hypothetical protein
MNPTNSNMNDANAYIHRLKKGTEKRRFARDYYLNCLAGRETDDSQYDVQYMAKQAVRMNLAEFGIDYSKAEGR